MVQQENTSEKSLELHQASYIYHRNGSNRIAAKTSNHIHKLKMLQTINPYTSTNCIPNKTRGIESTPHCDRLYLFVFSHQLPIIDSELLPIIPIMNSHKFLKSKHQASSKVQNTMRNPISFLIP